MFLITELIALLSVNLILMQALGTSTIFIAADSRKNLVGTAFVITVFTTVGSAAAYFINHALPENMVTLRLFFTRSPWEYYMCFCLHFCILPEKAGLNAMQDTFMFQLLTAQLWEHFLL